VLVWKTNWVLTYHYWPTSYNTHIFEGTCYFAPPKDARERLAQELAVVTFKEFALQDGNTLEATQSMLEANTPIAMFPLNDQEILLRLLHTTTKRYVEEYQQSKAPVPA
jgi:Ring hydroxylating alpha subunit (catalytic domain)